MKKLFRLFITAVVAMSVMSCYDDTAIMNALKEHENLIAALDENVESLKTLVEAVEGADYITSVDVLKENGKEVGYSITFAKHGTIKIYHGEGVVTENNSADQIFEDVYEKDGYMYFVLTDGTVYRVPMSASAPATSSFDIVFEIDAVLALVPDITYEIQYTIIGGDANNTVRTIANDRYVKAYAKQETASTGSLSFCIAPYDGSVSEEYYMSQLAVIVTATDGKTNSVTKALNLKAGVMTLYQNVYTVAREGGEFPVTIKTNLDYNVMIPDGITWLSCTPKTKSEIRTDELVLTVQPNEEPSARSSEVYLTNNKGLVLETIYVHQRGNGIIVDGDFSDWDNLDQESVLMATTAKKALYKGLKTLKVYDDGVNLNLYVEFDYDIVIDRGYGSGNLLDIYLSRSPDTGGYMMWSDKCADYLLEFSVLSEDYYLYGSEHADIYYYTGEAHQGNWAWDNAGNLRVTFARFDDRCEIAIDRDALEYLTDTSIDCLSIGVTVSQWWSTVGVLPNTDVTSNNQMGYAPMLALNGENSSPLPPEDEPEIPSDTIVSLIGDFNNWSDDLIMNDNGDGWYVAELTSWSYTSLIVKLNDWEALYHLSDNYPSACIYPGLEYELAMTSFHDMFIPYGGTFKVYISKDFTKCKYEYIDNKNSYVDGNLWDNDNVTGFSYWFANKDWLQIDNPQVYYADGNYTLLLPYDIGSYQWQGQFAINNSIDTDASKMYDFRLSITSNTYHPSVLIKLCDQYDDANIIYEGFYELKSDQELVLDLKNYYGVDASDIKIMFDFGGAEGLSSILIKDIVIKESFPVLTDELIKGGSMEAEDAMYWTVKDYWMMAEDWSEEIYGHSQFVHDWGASNGPSGGKGGCLRLGGENQFMQYSFRSTVYQPVHLNAGDMVELSAQVKWGENTVDNGLLFWCITDSESDFGYDKTAILELYNYWDPGYPIPAWDGDLCGVGLENYNYTLHTDVSDNGNPIYVAPSTGTYYIGFELRSVWGNCYGQGKDYYIDEISAKLIN